MKFTICDDTLSDLNALESIIISYARTNNCSIEIEKFNNPEVLLKHVEFNKDDYHIFFLDVVMQKNGIDVASKIRNIIENPIIPLFDSQ